jgi:hypothetical protein
MQFDQSKTDLLIQYILLIAGEEDEFFNRQLGPIHLIKYVYLADLDFASQNQGVTFTSVNWQFHKFGPWSQSINSRIEPALLAINAEKKSFPSDFEDKDDWVRWYLNDEYLLKRKENELPSCITLHLRRYIHKYNSNTPSLLDYVYKTKPILFAAPSEYLDFSLAVKSEKTAGVEAPSLRMENLSNKKKKKFKERIKALQDKYQNTLRSEAKLINPVSNPRYDDVYNEGILWLDEIAGNKLTTGEKIANFTDEVWKSSTRKGDDVS